MSNKHTIWLEYLRQTQIQYLLIAASKEINHIRVEASNCEASATKSALTTADETLWLERHLPAKV